MIYLFAAVLALVVMVALGIRSRRHRAAGAASQLIPEIRNIMSSADPKGTSEGDPVPAEAYASLRDRLPRLFSAEQSYGLTAFHDCVIAYREARGQMLAAFAGGNELSLGDRIRAKDLRDRCLKDLYYAGEAAIQKLQLS